MAIVKISDLHKNSKDITGQKFGKLTVLKPTKKRKNGNVVWLCLCDCGNIREVVSGNLQSGHTQSCGCLQKKLLIKRNTIHGGCNTPTYKSWKQMFKRCRETNRKDYKYCGGRGIKVCKRWHKFENFLEDMGPRPELGALVTLSARSTKLRGPRKTQLLD